MSDSGNENGAASTATGPAPQFTDRELQLLGWAMQSLKSGPPDVDYEKLAKFAGMSNHRSASNAWTKIRVKLLAGADGAPAKGSPKKTAPKKKTGEDGGETPKKAARKRPTKKQEVEGEDGSPKKKGRQTKAKKAANADIKEENDEDEDAVDSQKPKANADTDGDADVDADDDMEAGAYA
ncbi:hypothetical protein K504DRAFT_448967 [Pleomassaria siparia CBS 279.74]|uniref:Myb-like domain-containing protein n=1 Tax=Pleomassaria siparia CBS 279.74 TaxID=1314801 RepID=A0A6G1JYR9_9PLEO|nr:hypothetical protein K504DRAFT_448967 [Pleomassaria siparia CBS 279.74]